MTPAKMVPPRKAFLRPMMVQGMETPLRWDLCGGGHTDAVPYVPESLLEDAMAGDVDLSAMHLRAIQAEARIAKIEREHSQLLATARAEGKREAFEEAAKELSRYFSYEEFLVCGGWDKLKAKAAGDQPATVGQGGGS